MTPPSSPPPTGSHPTGRAPTGLAPTGSTPTKPTPDAVQAIAEPRRREILRLVWDAERSAGDIADRFDVTFGAVSQHLKVLREAGLVTLRQEGRRRYYRADRAALGPLAEYLESMWSVKLDALAELAEAAERAESGGRTPAHAAEESAA